MYVCECVCVCCHATDGPSANGLAGPSTANFVAINGPAGPSMAAMDGPAGLLRRHRWSPCHGWSPTKLLLLDVPHTFHAELLWSSIASYLYSYSHATELQKVV